MKTLIAIPLFLLTSGVAVAADLTYLQCELVPSSGSKLFCDVDKRFCARAFSLDLASKVVTELPDGLSKVARRQRVLNWSESYIEFSVEESRQKWANGKTAFVSETSTLINRLTGEIQETTNPKLPDGSVIDEDAAAKIVAALGDKTVTVPQNSRRTGTCRVVQKLL